MIDSSTGENLGQYGFSCIPDNISPNTDFSSAFIACQNDVYQMYIESMELEWSNRESGALINAIAISKDGRLGISAAQDGNIRVWNLGEQLDYAIKDIPADELNAIALTGNPDYLLVSDAAQNGVEQPGLWNISGGTQIRYLSGFSGTISPGAAVVSPDNKLIAVAGLAVNPQEPSKQLSTVAIWNIPLPPAQCQFTGFSAPARALAFSPDSNSLLAGSLDPLTGAVQLVLLDTSNCQPIHEFEIDEGVVSIAFNADGSRAITRMGSNGRVIPWDMVNRRQVRLYTFTDYGAYLPVKFGPDGQTIISSGPLGLIKLGLDSGNFIQSYAGLVSQPTSMAISPDGRCIVAS